MGDKVELRYDDVRAVYGAVLRLRADRELAEFERDEL